MFKLLSNLNFNVTRPSDYFCHIDSMSKNKDVSILTLDSKEITSSNLSSVHSPIHSCEEHQQPHGELLHGEAINRRSSASLGTVASTSLLSEFGRTVFNIDEPADQLARLGLLRATLRVPNLQKWLANKCLWLQVLHSGVVYHPAVDD